MCDYSLMGVPNRLATEGEELVTFRFSTGSMGLVSLTDFGRATVQRSSGKGFWARLRKFLELPRQVPVIAVCIPPGAHLILSAVTPRLQRRFGIGPSEEVTFTQMTAAANQYRDAIRFRNGCEILLQQLHEGERVRVLDLSLAERYEPRASEVAVRYWR
jgi:hypothetical protein